MKLRFTVFDLYHKTSPNVVLGIMRNKNGLFFTGTLQHAMSYVQWLTHVHGGKTTLASLCKDSTPTFQTDTAYRTVFTNNNECN